MQLACDFLLQQMIFKRRSSTRFCTKVIERKYHLQNQYKFRFATRQHVRQADISLISNIEYWLFGGCYKAVMS